MTKRRADNDPTTQVPPHNLDAEKAVLGTVLIDPDAIAVVADVLVPDDFYSTPHRLVYAAALRLWQSNTPADLMTLYDELRKVEQLEEIGGLAYLSSLENCVMSTANVEHHARIVRQKSRLRRLIRGSQEILDACYREEKEPDEIMAEAQSTVLEIATDRATNSFAPISEIVDEGMQALAARRADRRAICGLATHFDHLDEMTQGLQPSDLIIVAARPSIGKTSFALNVATNVALLGKKPVAIFSLEMSDEQIQQRILSALSRVPMYRIRSGFYPDRQHEVIEEKAALLADAPIYVDDTPALTVQDLRARTRRLQAEVPDLALIVVDYIQLMRGSRHAARENRQREVAEIAGELKAIAKQSRLPVIALSQLSRLIEQREKRALARPKLSDLRESGAIEQDADVVLFVHRDPSSEPPISQNQEGNGGEPEMPQPVRASLIIGKQRNGPTGEVEVLFFRQFTQFLTLGREHWEKGGKR